ncbi:OLC1v1026261C1 [Oldenlandia corymbosa var. corymbosa]|uniref:OLC1v1026261C1 n=1 Tax=Oldenlandia corymbosa var. corymbosa TaxID=529605 RepID=A0AAV1C9F7_OLDCO|nr:OLC1v1026261C1 [Oldenlandia corymbosa var. corymbosa]
MDLLRGCFGDIQSKEKQLKGLEESVKQRCEEFNSKRRWIEAGLKRLDEKEEFLKGAFQKMEMEEMKCREMRIFETDGHFELAKREKVLDLIEENLRKRKGEIDAKQKNLDLREEKVNAIERLLETNKNEIESEKKRLEERLNELDSRKRNLVGTEEEQDTRKIGEAGRETETDSKQKMLEEKDFQVDSRERHSETMAGRKRLSHADEEIKLQGSSSKHAKGSYCNGDSIIRQNGAHSLQKSDSIGSFASCTIDGPSFPAVEKGKQAKTFNVGETWACFDAKYHMPRSYAQVMNIINEDGQVKLEVTWLKPCSRKKAEKEWIDAGLPATCGMFERKITSVESPNIFSHITACVRDDPCIIIPFQGEIWAIYTDWDITKWISDPEIHKNCEYEIVEIMPYLSSSWGIRVAYLDRITESVNSFKRRSKNNEDSSLIDPDSIYRFSHRVPSMKKTYNDENGIVDCVFKLDQKCLPL